MLKLHLFFSCLAITLSAQVQAQSIAAKGKECTPLSVPTFYCDQTSGATDIHFTLMEFQTCENGTLQSFYPRPSAQYKNAEMMFPISTSGAKDLQITSGPRVHFDHWSADSSVETAKAVTITFPEASFKLDISENAVTEESGVSLVRFHYGGKFQELNRSGQIIAEGTLRCSVTPH